MQHFEILFILNSSITPLSVIIHIPRPQQIRLVCGLFIVCLSYQQDRPTGTESWPPQAHSEHSSTGLEQACGERGRLLETSATRQ